MYVASMPNGARPFSQVALGRREDGSHFLAIERKYMEPLTVDVNDEFAEAFALRAEVDKQRIK